MNGIEHSSEAKSGIGCVLRIWGDEFDVDSFLAQMTFARSHVARKGQSRSIPNLGSTKHHCINIVTSSASELDLDQQVNETIAFLENNFNELKSLIAFPGVNGGELDFSVARRHVLLQNNRLSTSLICLAGKLGLSINLSIYAVADDQ